MLPIEAEKISVVDSLNSSMSVSIKSSCFRALIIGLIAGLLPVFCAAFIGWMPELIRVLLGVYGLFGSAAWCLLLVCVFALPGVLRDWSGFSPGQSAAIGFFTALGGLPVLLAARYSQPVPVAEVATVFLVCASWSCTSSLLRRLWGLLGMILAPLSCLSLSLVGFFCLETLNRGVAIEQLNPFSSIGAGSNLLTILPAALLVIAALLFAGRKRVSIESNCQQEEIRKA
jgi:hypothetical protein